MLNFVAYDHQVVKAYPVHIPNKYDAPDSWMILCIIFLTCVILLPRLLRDKLEQHNLHGLQ